MVKWRDATIGARDIEAIGRWANTILNSRIGLALLIWGSFQFSLHPTLDEIALNTSHIALNTDDVKQMNATNYELLVRLAECCQLETRTFPKKQSPYHYIQPIKRSQLKQ